MRSERPAGAWPDLSEPRRALGSRVARFQDRLAEALLVCLDRLEAVHLALGPEAPSLAVTRAAALELAGAARLISFRSSPDDRGVELHPHEWGATPAPPEGALLEDARRSLGDPTRAVQRLVLELLDLLEELLREVLFSADTQAYVDAQANEVVYLLAATRIRRAATLAAGACAGG